MSEREANASGTERPRGLEHLAGLVDKAMGAPRTMALMAVIGVAPFAGSLISEGAQVLLVNSRVDQARQGDHGSRASPLTILRRPGALDEPASARANGPTTRSGSESSPASQ